MTAPRNRAATPTRSLLFLSVADAVLLLATVVLNLEPLLPLDGVVPIALAGSGVALIAAAACGLGAERGIRRPSASQRMAIIASLGNGVLITAVAVYFAWFFPLFGNNGTLFILLAAPGFVSAAMISRASKSRATGEFERF
jgi:hypothetical protein